MGNIFLLPIHYYLSYLSDIVPFVFGLYLYRYLDSDMKLLLSLFTIVLLVDAILFYMSFNQINNLWLLHIFTLIEYSFLILVFASWQKNAFLKRCLRLSIPLFALIWFASKLFLEGFNQIDNFTSSLESMLLVGVSAYTLYDLSKEYLFTIYKEYRFWVAGAVLIYFTGNQLFFALSNIINVWPLHSALNIIANLSYTLGFLCLPRHLKYGGLLSLAL